MNTLELSLKEMLYLISVKADDGRSNAEHLNFGLVGACLFELTEQDRITIKNKRIYLQDKSPTKDEALNLVLSQISKSRKTRKIKSWVSMLHNKSDRIKKRVRNQLRDKGILRQEKKKFLFIPYTLHPVAKTGEQKKVLQHLQKIIPSKKTFEDKEANLIALSYASGAYRNIFSSRRQRREAKKRTKYLIKEGAIASSVNESIQEMQAAITAAVAATAATTAAASSSN